MLEKTESDLAHEKVGAAEKWRLRERAELMRALLGPRRSPAPQ
jgi:hypothetical protein